MSPLISCKNREYARWRPTVLENTHNRRCSKLIALFKLQCNIQPLAFTRPWQMKSLLAAHGTDSLCWCSCLVSGRRAASVRPGNLSLSTNNDKRRKKEGSRWIQDAWVTAVKICLRDNGECSLHHLFIWRYLPWRAMFSFQGHWFLLSALHCFALIFDFLLVSLFLFSTLWIYISLAGFGIDLQWDRDVTLTSTFVV